MGCEERFKSQEPKQLKLERQLFYRGHQWGSKRWKIQKDVEKKVCVGVKIKLNDNTHSVERLMGERGDWN